MDEYEISIVGDNLLTGRMRLTPGEIETFNHILDRLTPDGKYVPQIIIRNLSEERRRYEAEIKRREAEERRRQQEFAEACSHLGKFAIRSSMPPELLAALLEIV